MIRGTGEMAERIREHAWNQTSLGSIDAWPLELLGIVNLLLASREIMTVFWGPDRLMIYNDAYTAQLGDRHPMLGRPLREVWPDVVDHVAPLIDPVFETGESSYLDDSPLTVTENGEPVERFYTASFEPIWIRTGETMVVGGVYQTAINNTLRVQLQRDRDKEKATLDLAQQVAQTVCWDWDVTKGSVVWVGDTRTVYGVPATDLGSVQQTLRYVHEDDLPGVNAVVEPALHGQRELEYEHRVVHPDGAVHWVAVRGRSIVSPDGEVLSIVGASIDVTAAKEAQAAIQQTAQQLRLAVEAGDLAIWYYDPVRNIVGGDPRMAQFFGLPEAEGPAELWIEKIHPDDRNRVSAEFEKALQGGTYDTEYRVCHGTAIRWLRAKANQSSEEERALIGICEDVTARKLTEANLQSTSERLRLAATTGRITSWDWNLLLGRLVWEDSEFTWGRPTEDLDTPEKCFALIHPDDASSVQAALVPAFEGIGEYRCEFRVCWPDGSIRWNFARGQGVGAGEDGKPTRIVGVNLDVTERKNTEAALLQNEKLAAVGRLASTIAHEVNNPLESVTNLLYLMRGSASTPELKEYVDTAERELKRVSLIANQTLQFHKQSTKPAPAFCYDLIGDSLAIFHGRVINNRVTVEKRKRAEHPIDCLGGEIRQVLNNLIGNALDAMPLGGRLLLRSREATDFSTNRRGLVLTVADTGTGMSRETQKRVFDAFYTTKGIGGTGLGLWISKGIAERHQGKLSFRSCDTGETTGSVFTLFLPFEASENRGSGPK